MARAIRMNDKIGVFFSKEEVEVPGDPYAQNDEAIEAALVEALKPLGITLTVFDVHTRPDAWYAVVDPVTKDEEWFQLFTWKRASKW